MNTLLKKKIYTVFIAVFFFSLHLSVTAYVNSSMIESFGFSNSIISLLYALSSIGTILGLLFIARIHKYVTHRKLILILIGIIIASIIGFLWFSSLWIIIPLIIFFLLVRSLVVFQLDVFTEHFSDINYIGRIRGLLILLLSIAWGTGPIIAGLLLDHAGMQSVYIFGIITALVPLAIFFRSFRTETFQKHKHHNLKELAGSFKQNNNLRNVFFVGLGMNIFYAMAVVYLPLHLYHTVGFGWSQIGLLILIGSLPFVLLSYPIGLIADRYIGEQEFMITGIIIGVLGVCGFTLLHEAHFGAWALMFFVSRIGLSMLENTSESYFFKNITPEETEKIAIQRNAIPLSYLLVSCIGIISGFFTESYTPIIIMAGVLLALCLYPAYKLHDTK